MVKKILYLITVIMMFQCGASSMHLFKKPVAKINIDIGDRFKPYFNTLDSIYKKNGIKIDYSRISAIKHIDSLPQEPWRIGKTFEGLYNQITKKIYINTSQMDAFWAGKYEEKILLVLAHEIAHSQGKQHSSDYCSIMYPNSTYTLSLLNGSSVEELVTAVYLEDYPLLEED